MILFLGVSDWSILPVRMRARGRASEAGNEDEIARRLELYRAKIYPRTQEILFSLPANKKAVMNRLRQLRDSRADVRACSQCVLVLPSQR
jgi:hypothetical protein